MATTIRDLLVKLGVRADTATVERFDRVLGGVSSTAARVTAALAGVGVAITGAGVSAVGLAADMEATRLTMRVLIGDAERAALLVDELIKKAAATPFSQGELIEGSKRLLRLTGDNIDQNLELLDVMGTMAALNPTKSVVDAVEALLDATSGGGFERLKEFGVTLRADDFQLKAGAEGYADEVIAALTAAIEKQTRGEDLVGALSQTFRGRLSTFRDGIESTMRQIGEVLLKRVGPLLDRLGMAVSRLQPRIVASVTRIADAFDRAARVAGPALDRILRAIERLPAPVMDVAIAAAALVAALAPLAVLGGAGLLTFGPVISALPALAGLLSTLAGAAASVVSVLGIGGTLLAALAAVAQAAFLVVAPMLTLSAVVGAVVLPFQDLWVTLRGGDGLIRRVLDWFGVGEQFVGSFNREVSALVELFRALGELAGAVGQRLAVEFAPAIELAERVVAALADGLERIGRALLAIVRGAGGDLLRSILSISGAVTTDLRAATEATRRASAAVAPSPSVAGAVAGGGGSSVSIQMGGDTINGVGLSAAEAERLMRERDRQRQRFAREQLRSVEL